MAETATPWTNDFEGFPAGRLSGAVTCFALRRLKSNVQALMSVQHTFDEDTSPEMTHIAGMCTVCGLSDGSPTSIYDVTGALWYNYTDGNIYRDYGGGVGLLTVGGADHGSLLNLTDADAHTIYIKLSGETDIQSLGTPEINGLSVTAGDYSSADIVSQGVHLTTPADHVADILTGNSGVSYGYDKLNVGAAEVVYDSATSRVIGTTADVSLGRASLFPILHADTTTDAVFQMLPLYNTSPPNNYEGGFKAYWQTAGRLKITRRQIT
jgi:hypothetical protein